MLVLSRRENQNLLFPNLGIKISVLRTAGNAVKLGIDAPRDVRVLREELAHAIENIGSLNEPRAGEKGLSKEERHQFRVCLNAATLGLQVLQQRLESGQTDDLESLIYRIFNSLHDLDVHLDESKDRAASAGTVPPRALVVEDNDNERQLLAEFLRASGYEVQVVANGAEAMEHLQQQASPDIVLMDMNMPEMDGPETIRSIREQPSLQNLRLYGVSGMTREEAGVPEGDDGVDRWFTKPLDARRLVEELRSELENGEVTA